MITQSIMASAAAPTHMKEGKSCIKCCIAVLTLYAGEWGAASISLGSVKQPIIQIAQRVQPAFLPNFNIIVPARIPASIIPAASGIPYFRIHGRISASEENAG